MDSNDFIKIEINKDKLLKLLSYDVSINLRDDTTVNYELNIDEKDQLDIKFYFEKYIYGKKIKAILKEDDISNMLINYMKNLGYVFHSFKYIGGIRKVGYYVDEATPYFEGIQVMVKEKSKKKIRK